jgi:hypothetical protein
MNRPAVGALIKGSVVIVSGTEVPMTVQLKVRSYWKEWKLVRNWNGHAFGQELRKAGWNFFFIADKVQGCWVGGDNEHTVKRATERALGRVKGKSYNCAQVSEIVPGRFLGIPYMRVTLVSRHVQRGNQLDSSEQRRRALHDMAWAEG